jgi:hypothetical protein
VKKAIVQVGFTQYVMDTQKAFTLLELLGDAEVYEYKWRKDAPATHHIYNKQEKDKSDPFEMLKLMPDSFYKLAKLAGKPNDE